MARPLDRLAIRSACGSVLSSPDGEPHVAEASALIQSPGFFAPEVAPAAVQWSSAAEFHFVSPAPSLWENNNVVRCRLVPAGRNWRERPTVILLHGWNAELQHQWLSPHWARLLGRAGVNGVLFELPLHGARRPRRPALIRNFLSGDLRHVMLATHQTLAELRALALWLRAEGSPRVGLWGVSLGGWLAGLAAAHHPEIDLAVLVTPVVRMDRALHELPFCAEIRDELSGLHDEFRNLNLVEHRLLLPRERMLILAGQWDLFAAPDTVDELEAAWGPEVWRRPQGHISMLMAPGMMRRVACWAKTKMAEPLGSAIP